MENEKRQHPRFECIGAASLQVLGETDHHPGKIENLSALGCLIVLKDPRPISVDTKVELTFEVNHLPFRQQAHVRANRADRMIGSQFAPMIPRRRHQLDELLQELDERQSKKAGGQSVRPHHTSWVRDSLLRVLALLLPRQMVHAAVMNLARAAEIRPTADACR